MRKVCPECKSRKTRLVANINERGGSSTPRFGMSALGCSYNIKYDELYQCKECKYIWLIENE